MAEETGLAVAAQGREPGHGAKGWGFGERTAAAVILWAVQRLSLAHIGELRETSRAGRLGTGSVVDTAEELRSHFGPLLQAGGIDAAALEGVVGELVEAGGLPHRLDLRGRGDVEAANAMLGRLVK